MKFTSIWWMACSSVKPSAIPIDIRPALLIATSRPPGFLQSSLHGVFDGSRLLDVHLKDPERQLLFDCQALQCLRGARVAGRHVAHGSVNDMTGTGDCFGGQAANSGTWK